MFQWFSVVTNTRGDALPGWQVGVVELDTQVVVPIFSDENGTPIQTVSGVPNRAVSDENGNYNFFLPSGTYSLQFFNPAGILQRTQRYVPMYGADFATDSANMTFEQSGTGAVNRSVRDKLRETASVDDFGAVGNGVTDDTSAFVAALAAANTVYGTPGKIYVVGDVVIPDVRTLDMRNAVVIRRPGADRVFWLQGFQPRLRNFDILATLGNVDSWQKSDTTASASAGASSVTVASATGFKAGMRFCIQSDAPGGFEPGEITGVAGNVLLLRKPLRGNVSLGARIVADFPLVKLAGELSRRGVIKDGVIRNCLFCLESGDPTINSGGTYHEMSSLRFTDFLGAGIVYSGLAAAAITQNFVADGGKVSSVSYTGNGSTTTFAYTWRFSRKAHRGYDDPTIRVRVNGVSLTPVTQYTVNDVAGTVTLATPPASGASVVVENFEFSCMGIYGDRLAGASPSALEEVSGGLCINNIHGIYLRGIELGFFYKVRTDTNTHSGLYVLGSSNVYFRDCDFLFAAFPVTLGPGNADVILDFHGTIRPDNSELVLTPNKRALSVDGSNTQVAVQGWRGVKSANISTSANISFAERIPRAGRSVGTVAAGSTVFLCEAGAQAVENDAEWRAEQDGYILGLACFSNAAPGASQSYTYDARVLGSNVGLQVVSSGASAFGGIQFVGAPIFVPRGQPMSVRLITSAGSFATRHQMTLLWMPL